MSNTNVFFWGYDRQLAYKLLDTIENYFTKKEKIHFSQKTIKRLVNEDINKDLEEDLIVYESEEPRPFKLIDLTNKIPESKHKILETYKNSTENNIFVCVFSADYVIQEPDKISLKKIYTLFKENILNNFFCLIDKSELNDEEYLTRTAEHVRAEVNFIFKDNKNSFDFDKYQKRVFFVELESAFKICQKEERSLLEELKESSFLNFLTELESCWEQIPTEENQEIDSLGYEVIKKKSNKIASVLEDVSVLIGKRKDESINLKVGGLFEQPGIKLIAEAKELADLAQDIRQGIFKLIVLGAFSNGKSTLINALLGEEVLVSKNTAATSIITMIVHGDSPDVVIQYKDEKPQYRMDTDSFFQEFTLTKEDTDNIYRQGSNRFDNIKYAQIECDYRLLENGVRLIDSPGLEDEKSRTDIVLGYLNECQAVVLVIDATHIITRSEREFIEGELGDGRFNNIFFVINKINSVREADVEETKDSLRERIKHHFRHNNGDFDADYYQRRVFFVDALETLEARTSNNNSFLLEKSGILKLEKELEHFLTSDARNTAVFDATFQRLSEVISKARDSINYQKKALNKPLEELENNRIEAEKLFNNLENQKEEIEQTVIRYGELISEKIFSSLMPYLNELKTTWEADSQEFELNKLNFGIILKSTIREKARENINRIIEQEIEQYLKKKLTQWSKNKIPTIIGKDVENMMSAIEKQVEDFQLELIQVDNLFATGKLLSGHELDTEQGKVSKTVQTFLNIAMLDASGLTGTLMGRGNWGSFFSRVVFDILIYGVFFTALGPILGLIAYTITELNWIFQQKASFKQRLLNSAGEKLHENLPREMSRQHDNICGQVQEQFKQQSKKLTEHLQAQINNKRTEQEDILDQKRQQSFLVEQENNRLYTIDNKLIELHNIAGGLVGRNSEE